MKKIYDIDVFTNPARIDNIIHYCHIQLTIKICNNKFLRVLVFSTEKPNCLNDNSSFFISGINLNTNKITPIPDDCIEKVLSAMENIHTNERVLNSVFHDIKSQYFAEGRKNTLSVEVIDFQQVIASPTQVNCNYRLRTKDSTPNGVLVQEFFGNVTLVKSGNQWFIDEIASSLTDSHIE